MAPQFMVEMAESSFTRFFKYFKIKAAEDDFKINSKRFC